MPRPPDCPPPSGPDHSSVLISGADGHLDHPIGGERRPSIVPHPDPRQVFVLSTSPAVHEDALQYWEDGFGGLESWTIQRGARYGAWFLIYVTAPYSRVSWIGRLRSDAHKPAAIEARHSWAWVEIVPLRHPVALEDIQADPVAGQWTALGAQLQGYSRQVKEAEVWRGLMSLILRENPDLAATLREWELSPPERCNDSLDDHVWEGDGESPFPYQLERPLQIDLHDYLIDACGLREPGDADRLGLPSMEAVLGEAGRADILLVDDDRRTLLIAETKLFCRTLEGVQQLVRYAAWARANRPAWEVELLLCGQTFSRACRRAAEAAGVRCWTLRRVSEADGFDPGEFDTIFDVGDPDASERSPLEAAGAEAAARAAARRLDDPPGRHAISAVWKGVVSAPTSAGLVAVWPRDEDARSMLGMRPDAAHRPLFVTWRPNIQAGIDGLGDDDLIALVLASHLGFGTRDLPAPMPGDAILEHFMTRLGRWLEDHLSVSWAELADDHVRVGDALAAAGELRPVFARWMVADTDNLLGAFFPEVARRSAWARTVDRWIQAGPAILELMSTYGDVRIEVDDFGYPIDMAGPESARIVSLPRAVILGGDMALRALRPGDWPRPGPDTTSWEGAIRELDDGAKAGLRIALFLGGRTAQAAGEARRSA